MFRIRSQNLRKEEGLYLDIPYDYYIIRVDYKNLMVEAESINGERYFLASYKRKENLEHEIDRLNQLACSRAADQTTQHFQFIDDPDRR